MMYLLDLSGHDENGQPGVDRFGGLFSSIEDAEAHGQAAVETGRLAFAPTTLWVRDQLNQVVRQTKLANDR